MRGDYGPIGRGAARGPRYSFRGAVEPNVCQWASTVVPRHRVGGPRPPAKALPYATGTAMCTIYSLPLSLFLPLAMQTLTSCVSLSPHLSVLLTLIYRCISLSLSSSRPGPLLHGAIRTRESSFSLSLFLLLSLSVFLFLYLFLYLFLQTGSPPFLSSSLVSSLFRAFLATKFAHLVTRSNTQSAPW